MERRVDAARKLISKRDERISELEHSLGVETERANSAQDELQKLRSQLSMLQAQLASREAELQRAKTTLGAAQTRLRQAEQQAQAAKRQVETQTQLMLSQERDIYVLRACLRGVVVSLNYIALGDDDAAIRALDAVERECRAAGRLL
jgi:chromosome segregation ATPase